MRNRARASRSTETRQAKEIWGKVMQLLVHDGIGESEYEHLLNHRPAAFRDGQLAVAPIKGWDTGVCRRLGWYSRWDAAARELGCRGLVIAGSHLNAGRRKLRNSCPKPEQANPESQLTVYGGLAPDGDSDSFEQIAWLHAVLAQVGLPRGRPKNPDGTPATRFSRTSGAATLVVRSGEINGTELSLPYGSRPRLMLADICTYAVKHRTREIDLRKSVREYLIKRLDVSGVSGGSKGTYTYFKNQAQALAACRMQLEASYRERYINYKGEPIRSFEAWSTTGLGGQQGLWPGKLLIDYDFYQTLVGRGMPLNFKAYRSLMRSPLAMDAYTWLAHRMWRIDGSADIRWDTLHKDMGQEYGQLRGFKRAFSRALKRAQAVYPDAVDRIHSIEGGIRLYQASPPVPITRPMLRNRKKQEQTRMQ